MSILNNLLGNQTPNIHDRDMAYSLLKDSKFSISCIAKTATETIEPQLRSLLSKQLVNTLNLHYELSDMMISKGWYPAKDDPTQQLQKDIFESPIKFKKDS